MASPKQKSFSEPMDLVLALDHEIGNLLAATRLHAQLIDAESTKREISDIAATIGALSSRMGSLLAQIRPLVSPVPASAPKIDAIEVLDGLQRGIEESCEARVSIDINSAASLPMAVIDPAPLHHMLLTFIYQALEESEPSGKVTVAAFAQADSIVFAVDDESKFEDVVDGPLKGRALLGAVADAILRPRGGQIAISSRDPGNRVELRVPAARY